MAFTHIQNAQKLVSPAATSAAITVSAVTVGNLVVISVKLVTSTDESAQITVTDNATGGSNTYLQTAKQVTSGNGNTLYQYVGVAVRGGATTITISWTGAGSLVANTSADEFHSSVAAFTTNAAAFDKSSTGSGGSGSSSSVTSFSPTNTGELIVAAVDLDSVVSAETAGTNYHLDSSGSTSILNESRLSGGASETAPSSWTGSTAWEEVASAFIEPTNAVIPAAPPPQYNRIIKPLPLRMKRLPQWNPGYISHVNQPPSCSLISPANGANASPLTPTLTFQGIDPELDPITYEIQVDTVNTFDSQGSGVTAIVEAWGAGGGGGGGEGGGGGGGAYSNLTSFAPVSGTGYTVTVGTHGSGGASGNNGTDGGDSSFVNTSTLLAKGGAHGQAGSNGPGGAGGSSGSGVGNNVFGGGNGGTGSISAGGGGGGSGGGGGNGGNASGATAGAAGAAGSYTGGAAGATGPSGGAGSTGNAPGGAGSGGEVASSGGNGADGQVKIRALLGTIASATGGTHTSNATYDYWTFTSSGTWTPTFTTGPLIDALSASNAGFADVPNPGDTDPFPSGDNMTYTVQSALTAATTYYWRVRGKDPRGTNTWGAWSSIWDFVAQTGNTYTQSLAAGLGLAGSQSKSTSGVLSAVLSFTGSITKTVGHVLAAGLSFMGTLPKQLGRAFIARLIPSTTTYCDYLIIQDSNATGGGWVAGPNSTNVSNNTGWIF